MIVIALYYIFSYELMYFIAFKKTIDLTVLFRNSITYRLPLLLYHRP